MGNLIKALVSRVKKRTEFDQAVDAAAIFKRDFLEANPHMVEEQLRGYSAREHIEHALDTEWKMGGYDKDTRYNDPKGKPQIPEDKVNRTIDNTEIYSRAKELILKAQRDQVGYGMEKYPEPLNADTWTILETIDHSISEKIDDLHYMLMLRIKLEREAELNRVILYGGHEVYMSGADMDGDVVTLKEVPETEKHYYPHGRGKCWCE